MNWPAGPGRIFLADDFDTEWRPLGRAFVGRFPIPADGHLDMGKVTGGDRTIRIAVDGEPGQLVHADLLQWMATYANDRHPVGDSYQVTMAGTVRASLVPGPGPRNRWRGSRVDWAAARRMATAQRRLRRRAGLPLRRSVPRTLTLNGASINLARGPVVHGDDSKLTFSVVIAPRGAPHQETRVPFETIMRLGRKSAIYEP